MRNRVTDTERLIKVIIYVRKNAGLSQMDLAKALGKIWSVVSALMCPIISDRVFTSIPFSSAMVAKV